MAVADANSAATGAERVARLVERDGGRVLDYFIRRTASADDAADLLGETLLVVWRKERAVPADPTEARMWLFGVARKVLLGQYRSARRRAALSDRLALELAVDAPRDDQLGDELRSLIAKLHPTDQEIVRLVYWDGFSLAEAAVILKMPAATVRSRHARARARLREELDTAE
jgi:RNA polymerase sigma-70 factor (ECF subfamily)